MQRTCGPPVLFPRSRGFSSIDETCRPPVNESTHCSGLRYDPGSEAPYSRHVEVISRELLAAGRWRGSRGVVACEDKDATAHGAGIRISMSLTSFLPVTVDPSCHRRCSRLACLSAKKDYAASDRSQGSRRGAQYVQIIRARVGEKTRHRRTGCQSWVSCSRAHEPTTFATRNRAIGLHCTTHAASSPAISRRPRSDATSREFDVRR
jgi:hypothetical protein